jgi:DNA polymerase I-like protein with 3'-5' exonuclease and polymerase domains
VEAWLKPVIALDIETTGLSPWRDQIHMVGLYDGERYLCIRNATDLHKLLEYKYKDYDIVGHRTDFDIKFLKVQGWLSEEDLAGRTIHDTRIIGSLLKTRVPKSFLDWYETERKVINKTLPKGHSHREGSPLSLKVMAPWYLKVPPFWETPGNHNNEEYNEKDCLYTYRLFQLLAPRLESEGSWDFYLKLLDWQQMLMAMEIRGISIDLAELDKVEQEYLEKRTRLKEKLDDLWADAQKAYGEKIEAELDEKYRLMLEAQIAKGKDASKLNIRYASMAFKAKQRLAQTGEWKLNYSSPAQMAWLLRDYLGLDIKDMEGEDSTGKAVLNKLAQDGREDIKTYLEWREADKVLTMYIPTYRELQVDGIIHPSFNLTGTRTGRTSSSGPNLQQVPPKLYSLFSPRNDYKFIQYDLSGIEAALIALYSGEKKLYEILEKGDSIHDHNAKALFNLECDVSEVSRLHPKERKCAKTIGFACFYGAGWRRIQHAFASAGFPISEKEAKAKLKALKAYYPEAFAFHEWITADFEAGKTIINLLGRPINLQAHENPYMQGFNTLIQSSASDLNLEACYRFANQSTTAHPLLVIHDCIMAESEDPRAEFNARALERHMTNFKLESIHGPIKLRVEGGVSERWEK